MLSHDRILANLVVYLALIGFLLIIAAPANAQTPIESGEKSRIGVTPAQPNPGATTTDATAISPGSNPAKTAVSSIKAEGAPTSAKADPPKPPPPSCNRTIKADVVALAQPIMLNRLGATIPDGMIFALKSDTAPAGNSVRLRDGKRP